MKQTFFNNIEDEIAKTIKNSNNSIYAMLAWFTNERLCKLLIDKIQNEKVIVKIIISNNEWNLLSKERFNKLKESGGEIRSYGSHNPLDGNFLHRKMCIVDEIIVMNGAFNWTKNASRNKEDYSINNDIEDANNCLQEFHSLWDISQELSWEHIQKYAKKTILELEDLENKGLSPLDFLEDKTIEKTNNQELAILNKGKMEIVNKNNDLSLSTDFFSSSSNKVIYENDLTLWGVEQISYSSFKLKFEIDEKIINIAIDSNELIELLKTESDYLNLWLRKGKILLSTLSNPKGRIKLKGPIHFQRLTTEQDLKKYYKCKYKIITEDNNDVVRIKVNRISTDNLDLLIAFNSENEPYID